MQHLVWKLLDFRYRRLLITTNAIKFWVGLFKSTNTTPQIMPNFYSITSTYIELDELGENWAALSYEFPKANTIRFQHPFCTPASPIIPIFHLYDHPPKVVYLIPISPQPFSQQSLIESSQILNTQNSKLQQFTNLSTLNQMEFRGLTNPPP